MGESKKLYEVEISDRVYVMATSAGQAERVARNIASVHDSNYDAHLANSYYMGWENEPPLNADADDNRTVREIIEEMIKQKEKKDYMQRHYRELPFK